MLEAIKNTVRRLIGQNAYTDLSSFREQLIGISFQMTLRARRSRAALQSLHNKYSDRRCFIFGNGPSLNKLDLTKLRGEITIGSNALFLLFNRMGFVPTFYTIEDAVVAKERSAEANAIQGTTKLYPRDCTRFFNDDKNTIWLNCRRSYRPFPQFSEDLSSVFYWGGTVSALNLQIAFWLGCPKVYLIGFDHSYKIPDDATIKRKGLGFKITSNSDDPNHFHPNYFGKGYSWHDPRVDRMEMGYRCAKKHFDAAGRIVQNATAGGKLEVFKRVRYEDLFPAS